MLPTQAVPEQSLPSPQTSSEPPQLANINPAHPLPDSPQLESLSSPQQTQPPHSASFGQPGYEQPALVPVRTQSPPLSSPPFGNGLQHDLPPVRPVFGVSLNELYARDGTAVPLIVYQCFQAMELFGLEVEGIYRLSGNANHINHMKALFDNGELVVDLFEASVSDLMIGRCITGGLHQPGELFPRYQ